MPCSACYAAETRDADPPDADQCTWLPAATIQRLSGD